ncbi:shikimate kinase [Aureitalea marina]|uniref:Shikimate kinase n=1 Tax=Aureitalea marina TaxID=930804 RepID=A0A2S7KMX6_9FLAO|nr:shikimate kinase [Aureitalea marina]PQB03975.1 shikimate kinase [Aureitalea marina]
MKIVLIGYMGSGKSSVGRVLADRIGSDYLDLDLEIQLNQSKTIPQIFKDQGEIYFRKIEAQLLRRVLCASGDLVLSSGGGTPCYAGNMDYMLQDESVRTVYLKCSLEVLTDRLWPEREERPLIVHLENKDLLNDFIRKHLFERSGYYLQAEQVINCDDLTPEQVALRIEETLL